MAVSQTPSWLGFRVLGILILGWLGMVVAQQVLILVLRPLGVEATDPAILGMTQLFGLLPAIHVARRLALPVPRAPSRPPIGPLVIGSAVLAGCALQFVLGAFSTALTDLVPALAPDPADMARLEETMRVDGYADAVGIPFCVVFVAPLTEELLFRGAIQPALVSRHGFFVGWMMTALFFGAFHLQPFAIVYASLAGLVLGGVARRAGSILPSFALHAGFNAIPILLPESIVPIPGFNSGDDDARIPLLLVISASLLTIGALLAFARLTEPPPDPAGQRTGPAAPG